MPLFIPKRKLFVPFAPPLIRPRRWLPDARRQIIPATAAVTRDATGTLFNQTDNTAGAHAIPSYVGLTVVSNTNGAILYFAHIADTTASPATGAALATVTGYALIGAISSVTANSSWVRTEIWGKVGNSTGAQTIACNSNASWSVNTQIGGWAVSWVGVNQSGGASSFANVRTVQGNTSNPSSGAITKNASGDATISALSDSVDVIAGPNKTQLYLDNGNSPSSTAQFETGGASTQTHTWTYTVSSAQWALVALDLAAVAAAAGGVPANPYISQPQLASILAQRRKSFVGWTVNPDHRFRPRRSGLLSNLKKAA